MNGHLELLDLEEQILTRILKILSLTESIQKIISSRELPDPEVFLASPALECHAEASALQVCGSFSETDSKNGRRDVFIVSRPGIDPGVSAL